MKTYFFQTHTNQQKKMDAVAVFRTDVSNRESGEGMKKYKQSRSTMPKEAPIEEVLAEARNQGARIVVLTKQHPRNPAKRGQYYFKTPVNPFMTTEEIIAECERNQNTTTRVLKNGTRRTKWDTRTIWIL
jgi:TPP-dependent trihydroxycyclohexane-1,2-dione (THcHDO) dehydratase